jgi:hypothetical protein
MRTDAEKEKLISKLEDAVKKGNLTVIAVDRFLRDHLSYRKQMLDSQLLMLFREGEHGSKLISVIAELSAIDQMEIEIKHTLTAAQGATRQLSKVEQGE